MNEEQRLRLRDLEELEYTGVILTESENDEFLFLLNEENMTFWEDCVQWSVKI